METSGDRWSQAKILRRLRGEGVLTTATEGRRAWKESVSAHYRISKDVYESLEEEARTRRVSMNTLVNQLLSTHTHDDVLLEEEGYAKVTKNTLRAALSLIPEDKLTEFGVRAAESGVDARMLARSNTISLETIMDELRLFSRSGLYILNEEKKRDSVIVSLMHDFGPRASLPLRAFVEALFALVDFHPKIKTTSSSITFEVKRAATI